MAPAQVVASGASNQPEAQREVAGPIRRFSSRSGAFRALLLFCVLVFGGCAAQSPSDEAGDPSKGPTSKVEKAAADLKKTGSAGKEGESKSSEKTPSPIKVTKGDPNDIPEFKGWNDKNENSEPIHLNNGGSAGAIPAVKPFNFGRDPGGPEDKTLYLDVPKIGLEDVPIYNSTTEEDLTKSAIHIPATGFPWQEGANTYIAGHRLGYPETGSFEIFFDLNLLAAGDEISVTDSAGEEYVYTVTEQKTVGLENVEVMNPVEGKSVISLQTCTLPDYKERIIVQGELVDSTT